jgi:predicted AlkP superfamily phosphohydrolase/phosphomutase
MRASRRPTACVALVASLLAAACAEPAPEVTGKRVVVLGFDGMDWDLTSRLLEEGRLPALARLAADGHAQPLGTALPPQSPVAWSDFITGLDAGEHGIFDFIHRDPETMIPYLSTSTTEGSGRKLKIGGWQIPLSAGRVKLLRHGTPFWNVLEAAGVRTTIIRIPADFPPTGTASLELSGMGTPDLLGGYGTFTLYTTRPERPGHDLTGGRVVPVRFENDAFRGVLSGPPNPFRVDGHSVTVEVVAYRDAERPVAKIVIDGTEVLLREGEWSDWVPVEFRALPLVGDLKGMVRLYLGRVHPDFELYVSPINIDPLDAVMPVSHPAGFAEELAEAAGRFYTQGMPEDTRALTSGALDEDAFLAQAELAAAEQRRQYAYLLDRFEEGLLFYYFGFLDQVSHVMWHPMDPEHPAHDAARDVRYADVIPTLYARADSIVAATLERLGADDELVVMSDHGFTSWRRAFNLNTWLKENGYLALKPGADGSAEYLMDVDWSRTQAYALGFSGLYINLRGRERFGNVPRSQYRLLRDEIARRLSRVADPATGEPAIAEVFVADETYADGGPRELGPDLVIGYAKGTRASDETGQGQVPPDVFADNTSKWSGDHIMHPDAVPGVLFAKRSLRRPVTSLRDLAAAIVAEFGIEAFPVAAVPVSR